MRKAINFDIDTKKYEEFTGKHAPTAYIEIKKFLTRNGFEHRQGSGYISRESLDDIKIATIIMSMVYHLDWLETCIKEIDVTNIGKQHSLIDTITGASIYKNSTNLSDIEIN